MLARLRPSLPTVALVFASYAFRLPPLLNARSTNSDAAVVGLQAMHLLRGELSPFLWGSGYQTSADAFVAALFFAVLGPSPLVLMMSALTLHVIATWLVFATLRRRFPAWTALLLTMPMIVSASSVHTYALYPPRQLSLTLALAAFFAIDTAREKEDDRFVVLGGALATLAVSADPYPLVLLPAIALFALLVRGVDLRRLARFAAGAAAGLVPFVVLHRMDRGKSGPMGMTFDALAHHWKLLVDECLPWALSYKVYYAHNVMDYAPWDAPRVFVALGGLGAILLFAMVGWAFVDLVRRGRAGFEDPITTLGLAGAVVTPLAIGGFLVSVMVMDHFSMRYLAVLTLAAPFAAAPAARTLGVHRFAIAFAPHLVASAIGGWVGYGPFVRGPVPVAETPELKDDYALEAELARRGVRHAKADYWASYRLTFLFRERLVVVPTNDAEDRYPPHRRAVEAAKTFAYVWDRGRSREPRDEAAKAARAAGAVDEFDVGQIHVFVVTRP